jgi:CO/xanthine dehydrogenase FAD-binding subunit
VLRLPRFTLVEPRTVAEAVRARADAGNDASYVAGGTDLWPNMKRRQQTPATVIALSRIKELAEIRIANDGGLTIGAGASLEAVSHHPLVRAKYAAVAHAA